MAQPKITVNLEPVIAPAPCVNEQTRSSWAVTMQSTTNTRLAGSHIRAGPLQPFNRSASVHCNLLKGSTMTEKTASVHWKGQGKGEKGQISTETGALERNPYGFASRFEDDRRGTNPEEILAAAHAACFTMAFSFACNKAGFATGNVDTQARKRLKKEGEGLVIDRIALTLKTAVPGIDASRFQEIALAAKRECPLSKSLASVAEISLQATLEEVAA
jgi:osmotically inducible protein OsmC